MKITDKDRLDFLEKYQATVSYIGGLKSIKWSFSIHSIYQNNYGTSLREAIDSAIDEVYSENN